MLLSLRLNERYTEMYIQDLLPLLPVAIALIACAVCVACINARTNAVGPMHTVRRQSYGKRTSLMR